jgi:hypothetical protein
MTDTGDHVTIPAAERIRPFDPRAHPGQVTGAHLTVLPGSAADREPNERETGRAAAAEREHTVASWQRTQQWDLDSTGYAAIQSTRLQTLAYGLTRRGDLHALVLV